MHAAAAEPSCLNNSPFFWLKKVQQQLFGKTAHELLMGPDHVKTWENFSTLKPL